ncbi:hypothetical protein TL16_g11542, partial [Triparma laevis f. inornata]
LAKPPSTGSSGPPGLCITQAYIVLDPQISGKIVGILVNTGLDEVLEKYNNIEVRDFGDDIVMPGIIDAQACFTEPGLTLPAPTATFGHIKGDGDRDGSGDSDGVEDNSLDKNKCWEGFTSGTQAAAAGGVTCVADFPCHGHKVTVHNMTAFYNKLALAQSKILVDTAFYALATPPNVFSTESSTSLTGMLKAGAIGVVAYLTTQSMGVPGLSGHDWNALMHKLNKEVLRVSEASGTPKKVPVMLSAVLMSPDRHTIVDPLHMTENPYSSTIQGEAAPLGLDFTFGCKSNGSSSENSPVKPELQELMRKNKEEGQRRMANMSNLDASELNPRELRVTPLTSNLNIESDLADVRDSLVTTPVSANRQMDQNATPVHKSRSLFGKGTPSPEAPKLRSAESNEGSATDLGELMSFTMDDEPELSSVPVYMQSAPRQLRRSGNLTKPETGEDLANAAKESLKEMRSEGFDFSSQNSENKKYPLMGNEDENPIVTQVSSYQTSGLSLSQRQRSQESESDKSSSTYGRLSPHRLSPPTTVGEGGEEKSKEGGKEWSEVDIDEIEWGKDPKDPPRVSAALEIPTLEINTDSEGSEQNEFESFVFTPDHDITFDEIERAKSPARGLSSSVKATLLSVERKSYKYKRPTSNSTSSVASSSDGADSPRRNSSPMLPQKSKSSRNISSSTESSLHSPSRPRVGWAESSSYSIEENGRFWKKNQKEMSQSGAWPR